MNQFIFNMIKSAAPKNIQNAMDEAFGQASKFDPNSLDGVKQALAASGQTANDIPSMLKAFSDSRLAPFMSMIPGIQNTVNSTAQQLMADQNGQPVNNQTTSAPNSGSVDSLRDRLSKLL